jgi:hypothetical protein
MKQDVKFSFSILKAFGLPPQELALATEYLGEIILAHFLELVEEEASSEEKQVLLRSLYQFKKDPEVFSVAVSEVLANNQPLQEKMAEMINGLYQELMDTFIKHASTDERKVFQAWIEKPKAGS